MKTCACGKEISPKAIRCTRCRCNLAQRRYNQTAKGQQAIRRYVRSEKARVTFAKHRAKRIFVGRQYYGRVPSAELAAQINTHIRQRRHAFLDAQREGAC